MRCALMIAWAALAVGLVVPTKVSAADVGLSHRAHRATAVASPALAIAPRAPARLPLALRTLSHRSASVLASVPCWKSCTARCGATFQACIGFDWLAGCMVTNNQCELSCLKQCRLSGGPLISWTDY